MRGPAVRFIHFTVLKWGCRGVYMVKICLFAIRGVDKLRSVPGFKEKFY